VSRLKIKIPSKKISADSVVRRDLIPVLKDYYTDASSLVPPCPYKNVTIPRAGETS
jgi:hypothetical protein